MPSRTYSELIRYSTFEDRLKYLMLYGSVGIDTFGYDRYLNQLLYHSPEWKELRSRIILRDHGCDLAFEGFEIFGKALIHHINPITVEDVLERRPIVFDPENLITTTMTTHQIIHYGQNSKDAEVFKLTERRANDTSPWRR